MDYKPKEISRYSVFHHIQNDKAPMHYRAKTTPEMKGGFVNFIDYTGKEFWLSGNITITKVISENI